MMNIPQIASVETAVRLYYEKIFLTNKDIQTLFPHIGCDTVQKLKKLARAKASEQNKMQYNSYTVMTESAYQAWGLDIDQLERRLTKLRKLGIVNTEASA